MEALLLAAGLGTRLLPLTDILPKCLMPIHGKPLLGIWLNMMKKAGVRKVYVNLHYKAEMVRDYVSNSPYSDLVTFIEEKELLGTAGTLREILDLTRSDSILVAHADNLTLFNMEQFSKNFAKKPHGCSITMMTFETDSPSQCGIVSLNKSGVVDNFTEKPATDIGRLANGAVYLINTPEIKSFLKQHSKISDFSTEIIPHYIGKINTFHNAVYHRDIGSIPSFGQAQKDMARIEVAGSFLAPVASYWSDNQQRKSIASRFKDRMIAENIDPEVVELTLKT